MILVVEDEPGIRDVVERGLRRLDLDVDTADDGVSGLARALDPDVELVVLDLMLPELSGRALLAELQRARPDVPVIIVSARGDVEVRVASLNGGAVDFMVKPFAVEELAARVRTHLRLSRRAQAALSSGDVEIDLLRRAVTAGGAPLRLSNTEYDLLVHLVQHQGVILGRAPILRSVWGYAHDPGTNVLDVYVGYLRRKLRAVGSSVQITTVRSRGFRLDCGPR